MRGKLRNRFLILLTDKEKRENRRIRQGEIIAATGVSPSTLMRWLRNEVTKFDGPVVEEFCAYFDCDLCDLLYLEVTNSEDQSAAS